MSDHVGANASRQAEANNQIRTPQLEQSTNSDQAVEHFDNRRQAIAQRQLQNLANNSPRSKQLKGYSELMQNGPAAAQLRAMQALMNKPSIQKFEDDNSLSKSNPPVQDIAQFSAKSEIQPKPSINNTGLPNQLKAGIETLSGMSLDNVKVNYNSDKPAQLNAHAYAQGTEIHISPGQEQHLPHEAWHVVQQAQGRVRPTMQMKTGIAINDDESLEKEADTMGMLALKKGDQVLDHQEANHSQPVTESASGAEQQIANDPMPAQRTKKDAIKFVKRKKRRFVEAGTFTKPKEKNDEAMNEENENLVLEEKEEDVENEEDEEKSQNIEEEESEALSDVDDENLGDYITTVWVKKALANEQIEDIDRKALFKAWNKKQLKINKIPDEFLGITERTTVSLTEGSEGKLKRSDSFTFGEKDETPDADLYLEQMTEFTKIITPSVENSKPIEYPTTSSIKIAGMYIRAYGESTDQSAGTKFVLNIGGYRGKYADSVGNGDLYYYPLIETDEEDVFQQDGTTTDHTWSSLANDLSSIKELGGINKKLARFLLSELTSDSKGIELEPIEIVAIGAMLSDIKWSIQGWLHALEIFRDFNFNGEDISTLFDVKNNPLWLYSVNAKNNHEYGRKSGLIYKQSYLEKAKQENLKKRKHESATEEEFEEPQEYIKFEQEDDEESQFGKIPTEKLYLNKINEELQKSVRLAAKKIGADKFYEIGFAEGIDLNCAIISIFKAAGATITAEEANNIRSEFELEVRTLIDLTPEIAQLLLSYVTKKTGKTYTLYVVQEGTRENPNAPRTHIESEVANNGGEESIYIFFAKAHFSPAKKKEPVKK